MSNIVQDFMTKANGDKLNSIPTVTQTQESLPEYEPKHLVDLAKSESSLEELDVTRAAVHQEDNDMQLRDKVVEQHIGNEVILDFGAVDCFTPYICNSYDELANIVLGNIFMATGTNNVNVDFFGKLLDNVAPANCSKVQLGNHTFIVREDGSDRLVYLFDFLAQAKEDLIMHKRYECPLVKEVEINYSVGYSLILTPKDLHDICKSFPQYVISYIPSSDIKDLRLVISIENM